jgi:integrase
MTAGRPRRPPHVPGVVTERRQASGKWLARTTVRDPGGVLRQVQRVRGSRSAARNAVLGAAARVEAVQPQLVVGALGPRTTVSELLATWLAEWRQHAPATQSVATYEGNIAALPEEIGATAIADATTAWLDRAIKARAATTPGAARTMRSLLRMAFQMAVLHGVLDRNPVDDTAAVPRPKRDVKVIEDNQVTRLLRHLETVPADDVLAAQAGYIAATLLATGARIGEVLALRRNLDVDLQGRPPTLTVAGTVVKATGDGPKTIRQPWPKGSRSWRTIPLPDWGAQAVHHALALPLPAGPMDLLFPGIDGAVARPATIRNRIKAHFAAAGVAPNHTPHSLRRTVGTAVARSRGVAAAADVLGNDPLTANRHYIAVVQHVVEDVRDVLTWNEGGAESV